MKAQLMKRGRKWSLYGVLLSAMAYAALTLNSQPAYAATCTQAQCQNYRTFCNSLCFTRLGLKAFECPLPGRLDHFLCWCNDGTFLNQNC